MKIKVTAKHIELGRRDIYNADKCIIARAFKGAGFKDACVGVTIAANRKTKSDACFKLPCEVAAFIERASDPSKTLEPFIFDITKKQVEQLRSTK